eukprot:8293-Heterococcus_DN1.PRE.2
MAERVRLLGHHAHTMHLVGRFLALSRARMRLQCTEKHTEKNNELTHHSICFKRCSHQRSAQLHTVLCNAAFTKVVATCDCNAARGLAN